MSKGMGLAALAAIWALSATSTCLAQSQRGTALAQSPSHLVALDEQDLKAVHGAGIDDDTLRHLGQGLPDAGKRGNDEARRHASSSQGLMALMAALDLQNRQGLHTSTTAVQTLNTAMQLGGTLLALTPISMLAPVGLPLFGMTTLPVGRR